MKSKIIGLTTMTESAAAYLKDGELKIAIEEERFSRLKHQGGIPFMSIDYILKKENISLDEIDILAIYWNPFNFFYRLIVWLKISILSPKSFLIKFKRLLSVSQGTSGTYSGWIHLFFIKSILKKKYGKIPKKIVFFDHHLSHMASSIYWFGSKNSDILIMDGSGETASTTLGSFNSNIFKKIKQINLPNSLGHFYSYFTSFIGFKMLDGEYKLMGLAPYGKPIFKQWLKKYILIPNNSFFYKLNIFNIDYHSAFKKKFNKEIIKKFHKPNSDTYGKIDKKYLDLASSVQELFEEYATNLVEYLKIKNNNQNLHIIGGCGLNCKSNGVILNKKIYKKIYVNPVPNDSGCSVGAAFLAFKNKFNTEPKKVFSPYLGYELENDRIKRELNKIENKLLKFEYLNDDKMIKLAAELLSKGNIISWCNGKMEFGARALGNRSFLADPRDEKITNELNERIKKRELFRPFAPSVLEENKNDFFDLSQNSDYMSFIVKVHPDKQKLIPAVTHHDNTARPQTVSKTTNLKYWNLINEFYKITNIPVLLNTSFNINEPIACTEYDCINTFKNSKVNYLFIGNYFVQK